MRTRIDQTTGSRRAARVDFLLTCLGKGCWVVAYRGRLVGGAVLSSLPAAVAYATDLAQAFGRRSFLLTVVDPAQPAT